MNKFRLSQLWDNLRSSYWFVPTLMLIGAIALSVGTVAVDQAGLWKSGLFFTYTRGPEGARAILSSIAGSMMSVAVTAFSITIVALQLASSQFGPRLLRNFMRDTGNQIVLGTFIATFIYCLLTLRTIRAGDESEFVPHLSVTLAILLAIASLCVLIYFIHHAAASIQAENVIAEVSNQLEKNIDRIFPQQLGQGSNQMPESPEQDIPDDFESIACWVMASASGYLQMVDQQRLMKLATQHNLLLRLHCRPGQYVVRGDRLVQVYPLKQVNKSLSRQLNHAFILGSQRTQRQDVEFLFEQLVEIAVRALSPGINDPFTAIICIHRLSSTLTRLVTREIPSPYRYDDAHKLRVMVEPVTFDRIADLTFHPIRHYGSSSPMVLSQLLQTITVIATHVVRAADRTALLHHAKLIWQTGQNLTLEQEKQQIEQNYQTALTTLQLRHPLP